MPKGRCRLPMGAVSGTPPAITKLAEHDKSCGIPGGQVGQVKVPEITATELKKMVEERTPFVLIDVREPHEYQICRIPGSKLMPLGDVLKRMHELNSEEEIVVHCRSGVRSARAVEWLMKAGFRRVRNLKGGVLAWAEQVDPSVPKY